VACVDSLYAADGTCAPNLHPVFPSFTALPVPNDFRAECFRDMPPCTLTPPESRHAVDGDGNLLLPVNWQGILASSNNVPVPRLIAATIKSPVAMAPPLVVAL